MAKKSSKPATASKEPFTAKNLIEYLQTFPEGAIISMTHVTRRGKEIYGYPVKRLSLITDTDAPHILIELGKAVPVERPAQRIARKMKEEKENTKKAENTGKVRATAGQTTKKPTKAITPMNIGG